MAGEQKSFNVTKKLRFGIVCDGARLPAVFAKCVHELLSLSGVELALVIIDTNCCFREPLQKHSNAGYPFSSSLWKMYAKCFFLNRLPAFKPIDMSRTFSAVPKLCCHTVKKPKLLKYYSPQDTALIRGYKLDFILFFDLEDIGGDIVHAAKYGVWSFYYGDETKFRGYPPAFWEIYYDEPVTASSLQRLTDRDSARVVLQRCFIRTKRSSPGSNLDAIAWASGHMPGRVCRDILLGGAAYLHAPPVDVPAVAFCAPTNFQLTKLFWRLAKTWVGGQIVSILCSEDWNVGIVRHPIQSFLDPNFHPRVEWADYKRKGSFIADPFLLRIGTSLRLLVEEFSFYSNRGSILETELADNETHGLAFKKAFDETVHVSYPYLFEWQGGYYCTPETYQKRRVSLYVFDVVRDLWMHTAVLINDFAAVDPTLFHHEGQWWLFCTNYDDNPESKLFLWYSKDLLGPWKFHPANPVKADVRSSRPAGSPFVYAGQLYRPAQDCSRTYGGSLSMNRVTRLTTREFAEEPVAHVSPISNSRYNRGIHNVSGEGSITVLDGKRFVFAPEFCLRRLNHKLRKFVGIVKMMSRSKFGGSAVLRHQSDIVDPNLNRDANSFCLNGDK